MKDPLHFIYKISLGGFLLTIFLCFPLWHGSHTLPAIPVLDLFSGMPHLVNYILLGILLVALVSGFFVRRPAVIIPLILISTAVLFLFDVNRLHPEFYIFSCVLLMVYLYESKKEGNEQVLFSFRILISAVYIFAGLNKLNDCFFPNVYEPMMRPLKQVLPQGMYSFFMAVSWLVPLLEIFIGMALWIPRFKKISWKLSLFFHAAILCLLVIHNTNYPVFPWNAAMAAFVFILSQQEQRQGTRIMFHSRWVKIALCLFVIVPSSHFISIAGSYISFDVYSGKYGYTYVYVPPSLYARLPAHVKKYALLIDKEHEDRKLYIDDWAFKEIKVPVYYETWALRKYKKYIEQYAAGQQVQLVVMRNNKEELVE